MYQYEYKHRVQYADTDKMGFVYHGNYARYYEQARTEAIRASGIAYSEIEATGVIMPVTRMNIKFIQAAYYDEVLTIRTTIPHLPHRIIIFNYEVMNEKGLLINEGETHLAFIDVATKKIKAIPDILLEWLRPYYK